MMRRRTQTSLASILSGIVLGAVALSPAAAAPARQTSGTATAHNGALVLTIKAQASGNQITAHARLTNSGATAWKYYGACAPPVLQIQARDANGAHVYGWLPPRVSCLALSIKHLAPGASLTATATFTAQGTVYVKATVPVTDMSGKKFATHEVVVQTS